MTGIDLTLNIGSSDIIKLSSDIIQTRTSVSDSYSDLIKLSRIVNNRG